MQIEHWRHNDVEDFFQFYMIFNVSMKLFKNVHNYVVKGKCEKYFEKSLS